MKQLLSDVEVTFPYEPYPVQLEYMSKVIDGLKNSKNCLLESPTGSGKTLSLLCSTLSWQNSFKNNLEIQKKELKELSNSDLPLKKPSEEKIIIPKIFYGTRTHTQITQIIRELKKTSFKPIMDILASRKHYCINEQVKTSQNINEECRKKKIYGTCEFYPKADALSTSETFKHPGSHGIWDMEDWVAGGNSLKACPYYAAQYKLGEAEIIFCPYNYLIDPNIRHSVHIDLKDNVIIIDEAHNIEDVSRDAASISVEVDDIEKTVKAIEQAIKDGELRKGMNVILMLLFNIETWMSTSSKRLTTELIFQKESLLKLLKEWGLTKENYRGVHLKYLELTEACISAQRDDKIILPEKSLVIIEHLFCVFNFMFLEDCKFINDYHLVLQKNRIFKNQQYQSELMLHLWCMNPRVAFHEISKLCRSIILTSGTLSPMDSFSSELEVKFDYKFEGSHVINLRKQLLIGSLSKGPGSVKMNATFKESNSEKFQDSLGQLILDSCRNVKFGVLCFFPSYAFMDKLKKRWEHSGMLKKILQIKEVIFEGRGIESGNNFKLEMDRFYNSIKDYEKIESEGKSSKKTGGLCLAICRGKISEGIDFSNNRARLVVSFVNFLMFEKICVGIPFPNVKDLKIDLKKRFNDQYSKELNGQKWYCQQAYRAINQAIGRCIRHKDDYGSVFLVDERYNQKSNINGLSKWMRAQVKSFESFNDSQVKLKSFLKDISEVEIPDDILSQSLLGGEFDIDTSEDEEDPLFLPTQILSESTTTQNDLNLTQVYSNPKTNSIIPTKRKFEKSPIVTDQNTDEISCKNCLRTLNSSKIEEQFILKDKPFLMDLMKNLGYLSFEICVLRKINTLAISDVVPQNCKIEKSNIENKIKIGSSFEIELPNLIIESGKKFNSGWIESDGVVYQFLFCLNCKNESPIIGVKLISTNTNNLQHLDRFWIFKEDENKKNKKIKI